MYKKKKIIFGSIPAVVFVLKMLLFIPVNISGGFAGVNYISHADILTIINNRCKILNQVDYFNYDILVSSYLIEGAITLLITGIIVFIAYKIYRKIDR